MGHVRLSMCISGKASVEKFFLFSVKGTQKFLTLCIPKCADA